ncbi:hypothetical protein F2P81_019471 [Scophthalmus maximus]|uniref:Uncharacterized protein n=1 Tax=Scophthalmus maximus TaxID=52904 RepID=A0A6A4SC21_SCOMX|nr:hypothetical protein F2P81_019471 [Scophthalmus maximus]
MKMTRVRCGDSDCGGRAQSEPDDDDDAGVAGTDSRPVELILGALQSSTRPPRPRRRHPHPHQHGSTVMWTLAQ